MSRPFNLTTDSTWPFNVCNSLNLTKTQTQTKKNIKDQNGKLKKDSGENRIPCNLGSPFGFLSHLVELGYIRPVTKHFGVGNFKPVKGPLRMGPLELTLFLTEILLSRERNLKKKKLKSVNKKKDIFIYLFFLPDIKSMHTLFSITRSHALPLSAYRIKNFIISSGK